MITLREAAQQALEAYDAHQPLAVVMEDLRAALAEPVQEPVGYLWPTGRHPEFRFTQQERDGVSGTPVYLAPPQHPSQPVQEPQRPWTNLTDHELEQAFGEKIHQGWDAFRFAAHIQDLLREKNA